jgi:lipoate-protein ligase A
VEFNNFITKIKITGDFFLHPECVLDDIERSVCGLKKDVGLDALVNKIQKTVNDHDAQMIGVSSESLALSIYEALK